MNAAPDQDAEPPQTLPYGRRATDRSHGPQGAAMAAVAAVALPQAAPAPAPPRGVRFDLNINLGHVMQAGMIGLGLILWLVSGQTKTENVAAKLESLQGQVEQQSTASREQMADGLRRVEGAVGELKNSVAALPDINARIRQMESDVKRLQDAQAAQARYLDERRGVLDQRFQALEQRAIENRASLDQLMRASGANLPGARGWRPDGR